MKKIEKLNTRVVLDLSKSEILQLRGGHNQQAGAEARTVIHDTHVNTCFTKNCCNRMDETDVICE